MRRARRQRLLAEIKGNAVVEKVNPDLVVRDEEGTVTAGRYEAVNTMLLNEFLEQHRTVQDLKVVAARLEATIAQEQSELHSTMAEQQERIEALTAGLQKVYASLEARRPKRQLAANDSRQGGTLS